MTQENETRTPEEQEIITKKEAFLNEYKELSKKHNMDFSIVYAFDQYRGQFAQLTISQTNVVSNEDTGQV